MNDTQAIIEIQESVGVKADGIIGHNTISAIHARVVGDAPPKDGPTKSTATSGIKVCIDPGHGMANRRPGIFDSGCEHSEAGIHYYESDIVLRWAEMLAKQLMVRGIEVILTREDNLKPTPLASRAQIARDQHCTHLVSIHVNDSDDDGANGVETLYRNEQSLGLAESLQRELLAGLKLRDRGVKLRTDLAVLVFPKSCLLELGFIANDRDRETITDSEKITDTCIRLAEAIKRNP